MRFIVSILLTGLLCMQSTAFAGLQEMQKDIDQRIQGFENFTEYTGNTLVRAASDPTFKSYFLTNKYFCVLIEWQKQFKQFMRRK